MKRLLAYLFIVLGLGLMLNVSAHAYVLEACVQNPKFDSNLKFHVNLDFFRRDVNRSYRNCDKIPDNWPGVGVFFLNAGARARPAAITMKAA